MIVPVTPLAFLAWRLPVLVCLAVGGLCIPNLHASSWRMLAPCHADVPACSATSHGETPSRGILISEWPNAHGDSTISNQSAESARMVLRSWYRQASTAQSADGASHMSRSVAQLELTQPNAWLHQGFRAVAELMLANHSWNPAEKLSQFLTWQPILEEAIQKLPEDPDLAFLRLGVQTHVPAFLSYHQNIPDDRHKVETALIAGFWSDDPTHEAFVRDFLSYLQSL